MSEHSWENFNALDESAGEFGVDAPDAAVREVARSLLQRLCARHPAYYRVYPFSEGRISINASLRRGHSFLILLRPDGKVLCFLAVHGKGSSQVHYDTADSLQDEFLEVALGPAHD